MATITTFIDQMAAHIAPERAWTRAQVAQKERHLVYHSTLLTSRDVFSTSCCRHGRRCHSARLSCVALAK